jgi:sterol desaturase/sphingolipid hydroxylase (fatty acid hydroxylase superfamily)
LFIVFAGLEMTNPTAIDKMPGPLVFTAQIAFCAMVEDTVFYMSHGVLHHPRLYPKIHKVHHEHRVTFCLTALHAHPLEFIFGNVVPVMIGPAVLGHRMHMAAMFGWYFVRSWESADGHCGYQFSWSPYRLLPWQTDGNFHFFHHEQNVGNYAGFFNCMDTVFGTNAAYNKHMRIKQQ